MEKEKDPYIGIAEKALKSVNVATLPGNFLVNVLPILSHVPDWFPGAGFKKKAREWRKLQDAFREEPFARTIKDMVRIHLRIIPYSSEICFLSMRASRICH